MPPQQILDTIRQVHAGKKVVPARIAAGLAEHLGDEALRQARQPAPRCVSAAVLDLLIEKSPSTE
jgi:hypothetical protein